MPGGADSINRGVRSIFFGGPAARPRVHRRKQAWWGASAMVLNGSQGRPGLALPILRSHRSFGSPQVNCGIFGIKARLVTTRSSPDALLKKISRHREPDLRIAPSKSSLPPHFSKGSLPGFAASQHGEIRPSPCEFFPLPDWVPRRTPSSSASAVGPVSSQQSAARRAPRPARVFCRCQCSGKCLHQSLSRFT